MTIDDYEVYANAGFETFWKNFNGGYTRPPKWSSLNHKEQDAWMAAIKAVVDLVVFDIGQVPKSKPKKKNVLQYRFWWMNK